MAFTTRTFAAATFAIFVMAFTTRTFALLVMLLVTTAGTFVPAKHVANFKTRNLERALRRIRRIDRTSDRKRTSESRTHSKR